MTIKSFIRVALVSIAALSFSLSLTTAYAEGHDAFVVVDILPLKKGASMSEAAEYLEGIEPILAKYGMTRTDERLDVVQIARGNLKAQLINLWETDNPDAGFKGIFADEDYKTKWVPVRDRIFDLKKATIIVTKRESDKS